MKMHNFFVKLSEKFRKYAWMLYTIAFILFWHIASIFITLDQSTFNDICSDITSISSSFAFFLLSAYTILIGLPNNKFISLLKKMENWKVYKRAILISIGLHFFTLIVSLLRLDLAIYSFFAAFGASLYIIIQIYTVIYYSDKSS